MLFSAINYPLCFWEGTRKNRFCLEWWLLLGRGTGRRHSAGASYENHTVSCGSLGLRQKLQTPQGERGQVGTDFSASQWVVFCNPGNAGDADWQMVSTALGLDGVPWMCDLIVAMPPHGSSCWMGAAQSVYYALGGTEHTAQLLGDWMIPWVLSPVLRNEQTWISAVPAPRSVRSSRLSLASLSTCDCLKTKQNKTSGNNPL